jgi:hypothetical protein
MQRMLSTGRVLAALVTVVAVTVVLAAPAAAACHRFTVSADPAEVIEGDTVTVTVMRDGPLGSSSVDVVTVDQTAVAGVDYEPLSATADFADGVTSQTFTINTIDVEEDRGRRNFRLELRNPQGCEANPNLVLGAPARVTIVDRAADEPEEPVEEPTDAPEGNDSGAEPADDPTGDPTDDPTDRATEQAADGQDAGTEGPTDGATDLPDGPTELTEVAILEVDDEVRTGRAGTAWLVAGLLLALGLLAIGGWLWFRRSDEPGPAQAA